MRTTAAGGSSQPTPDIVFEVERARRRRAHQVELERSALPARFEHSPEEQDVFWRARAVFHARDLEARALSRCEHALGWNDLGGPSSRWLDVEAARARERDRLDSDSARFTLAIVKLDGRARTSNPEAREPTLVDPRSNALHDLARGLKQESESEEDARGNVELHEELATAPGAHDISALHQPNGESETKDCEASLRDVSVRQLESSCVDDDRTYARRAIYASLVACAFASAPNGFESAPKLGRSLLRTVAKRRGRLARRF